jgi:hypothetical protein
MTNNQEISTMFNINTSIHVAIIVPFQDLDEDPGNLLGAHLCYVHSPGCDGYCLHT